MVPDSAIGTLIAIEGPKLTAPTVGTEWKQLLGTNVIKVDIVLAYDDGYGDQLTQEWCEGLFVQFDAKGAPSGLAQGDCNSFYPRCSLAMLPSR